MLVYRQPAGSHVIRFEDLEVSNGPDLLVILSQAPLVNDRAAYSAAEYLSLGDLKGNKGNQNYEVPSDVNLGDYQTVAIWCRRFNYTFNAADSIPHLPRSIKAGNDPDRTPRSVAKPHVVTRTSAFKEKRLP